MLLSKRIETRDLSKISNLLITTLTKLLKFKFLIQREKNINSQRL